jgi:hypothetical protein
MGEWYTVHDHLWAAAGMERLGGCLCIGCLEARLGRRLTAADFPRDAPVNWVAPWTDHSDRLRDRLATMPCEQLAMF